MNSDRIQTSLINLFQDSARWPHPHRRLVFWYDPDGQFQDTFNALELSHIKKLTLGTTPFHDKYQLLIEDPKQDYLLYAPFAEPAPQDNWLFDLQKTALPFSADQAALLYADLGFQTRSLETLIRRHLKFFASRARSEALQAMNLPSDTAAAGLKIALLSVLSGLKVPDPNLLIRQVLMGGLLETENPLWLDIEKFVSHDAFWEVVQGHLTMSDPKPSLKKLASRLLITHLDTALHGSLPLELEPHVISPAQKAYAFVDQWMRDQQDRHAWKHLSQEISEDLKIFQRLEPQAPSVLQDAATFEAIDQILIRQCVTELKAQSGDLKNWVGVIQARRSLVWFSDYQTTYEALEAAIRLVELKRHYSVGFRQAARFIFQAYSTELYQFDQAYRHFIVASDQAKPILREQGLIEFIENLYVHWYLEELGGAWSDSLDSNWQIEGIPSQADFYKRNVKPILSSNEREKAFVIISDALRYEVAQELKEAIAKELRGNFDLQAQLGVLPSITRLGMAALLPGKTLELIPNQSNVLRDGLNTQGSEARLKALQELTELDVNVLNASDLLAMSQEQGRDAVKPYRLIYIYHDAIDSIGDKPASERMVLDACITAIQELLKLVKRLCNSLNATHLFITSDHGFLYQRKAIAEADKLPIPKADDVLESKRRVVLRTQSTQTPGTLEFKLPYETQGTLAVVPRGSLRFALQGRGSQFVHGGASLQEVCVPVITYRHKRAEKGDEGPVKKVGVQIIALNRIITNNRFSFKLMQIDPVGGRWRSRRVTVALYDSSGHPLTEIKTATLISESPQPSDRETRQNLTIAMSHPPSTGYLIVKDADDDIELLRETWTISISIMNDFGDF